jgi:hypothetical protein
MTAIPCVRIQTMLGVAVTAADMELLPAIDIDGAPCRCCGEVNMAITAFAPDGTGVMLHVGPQALDHIIGALEKMRIAHRASLLTKRKGAPH